jgi:type VI secretion system protein ImpE
METVAEQRLREGKLAEALSQLQHQIKQDPTNGKYRIFLFQLLAVLGEWNRALTQLELCADMDAGALPMARAYREVIRCEVLRAKIFAGQRAPTVFGDPERWLALLLESLKLGAAGQHAQALSIHAQAFEAAPATAGMIDDQPFAWIADADSRLGPVLEVIVNGRYYWAPFRRIRQIRLEKPSDLRDVVWMPAEFTWENGGTALGFVPTRYPGSEGADDAAIRLARRTTWSEPAPGLYEGLGQRILATDIGDYALMDVRRILLQPDAVSPGG